MAIVAKKKKVQAADKSTSLHFPNETNAPAQDTSGVEIPNNQEAADTLIDPDDAEGGATHFRNETNYGRETNRLHSSKKTAASKPAAGAKPVTKAKKAASEVAASEFADGGEDNPSQSHLQEEFGLQDTQHMNNDEDPAEGYLTVGEADDEDDSDLDLDGDLEEDEDEVNADFMGDGEGDELENGGKQSLLDTDDEWDPAPVNGEFDDEEEEDDEDESADEAEEGDGNLDDEFKGKHPGDVVAKKAALASGDEMPLLDVDGTDDEGDDVVFANIGNQLKVIKANRIVASMGKKIAAKAGHGDVYLSDQFQEVASVEFSKHGLRAGLRKMGFVLATVNVAKSDTINKRVEAKAKQVSAAVRRTSQAQTASLQQALAIAAVGINRSFFKDAPNELRAALEEELNAAGVRNSSRLVRRVFAANGISYAKSILTVAQKLVAMPETMRNQFADALDLTSEDLEDEDDLFGESGDELGTEFGADAGDEFTDAEDEDEFVPATVSAALRHPARRDRSEVSAKASGYSVNAAAVLSGKAQLPFLS